MDSLPDPVRDVLRFQARGSAHLGSPFVQGVLERIADPLAPDFAPFFMRWAGAEATEIFADVAPLRLLGGLHDLALSGAAPALSAEYPAAKPATEWPALEAALRDAARDHAATLHAFMASPPQTNEVRRSLALLGGFLTVAKETGLPLRCLELGASAGLNQNWDRFRYDLGGRASWGDPTSPVLIDGAWSGGLPPLDARIEVVERVACDQAPLDIADPVQARRLQAYIWPDQLDRLARLRAAIALARDVGIRLERADAADWAEAHARPRPGVATVLYHSVFWQYPPQAVRDRLTSVIQAAGAAATAEAPFAWLRLEPDQGSASARFPLRLTLWPGGEERLLAQGHPHGSEVEWLGA